MEKVIKALGSLTISIGILTFTASFVILPFAALTTSLTALIATAIGVATGLILIKIGEKLLEASK